MTKKLKAGRKKGQLGHSIDFYEKLYDQHYKKLITIRELAEMNNCTPQNIVYLLRIAREIHDEKEK